MKIVLCANYAVLALFGVLIVSTSCSPTKDKQAAEAAVTKFHAQLNAEQYHDIYSKASDEFKTSDSEANIAEFLGAVHHKLGNVKNSTEQSLFVISTHQELLSLLRTKPILRMVQVLIQEPLLCTDARRPWAATMPHAKAARWP